MSSAVKHNSSFLSGWGRYPSVTASEAFPRSLDEVRACAQELYQPRGQGRSYGDAGLPASGHLAVNSAYLNRFLSFDSAGGILEAEAGVTFQRILRFCVPRGFFLPVTPGTMFVSLGGALASNVHGKNHHLVGSIENFVLEMEVHTPAGVFTCSAESNRDLFHATLGGYGLTGLITRAKLKLRAVDSAHMDCTRLRAANLETLFRHFREQDAEYAYSVAWIDGFAKGRHLGRGILMLGNHAQADQKVVGPQSVLPARHAQALRLRVPFPMPAFFLNDRLLAQCNRACFYFGKRGRSASEGYETFFYPLDRISGWNLLYGQAGFFQYQCMIPDPRGEDGITACLKFLSDNRLGSFLSVLKRCGDDRVALPFCRRGYTLALDIPHRGPETLKLLDALDALVLKFNGKIYLTKDARLRPETFRAMYPEYPAWMETVHRFNPEGKSRSRMAERLELWKG